MSAPVSQRLFLFAGEQSGDHLGANLVRSLKQQNPTLDLYGVGGDEMKREGLDVIIPMEAFQVMGVVDVLKALPKLWQLFRKIRKRILDDNPDGVVFIDYPGFNLRMARALRKAGYRGKLTHYVAPTVWAHAPKRIETLVDTLDLLLLIYPFEAKIFEGKGLPFTYVGNPLMESFASYNYSPNWRQSVGISEESEIIGIFPGSRKGEIERNLRQLIQAAILVQKAKPLAEPVISVARDELKPLIQHLMQQEECSFKLCSSNQAYDLMKHSRIALATSGTVTRELAIHRVPTVVTYCPGWITGCIARCVFRINLPFYCMVNIMGEREIYPEFVALTISPREVANEALRLMPDGEDRQACVEGCAEVMEETKGEAASEKAAHSILELFHA